MLITLLPLSPTPCFPTPWSVFFWPKTGESSPVFSTPRQHNPEKKRTLAGLRTPIIPLWPRPLFPLFCCAPPFHWGNSEGKYIQVQIFFPSPIRTDCVLFVVFLGGGGLFFPSTWPPFRRIKGAFFSLRDPTLSSSCPGKRPFFALKAVFLLCEWRIFLKSSFLLLLFSPFKPYLCPFPFSLAELYPPFYRAEELDDFSPSKFTLLRALPLSYVEMRIFFSRLKIIPYLYFFFLLPPNLSLWVVFVGFALSIFGWVEPVSL